VGVINPYVELTEAFNRGRLRAIISSGQAVVLHKLAVMSKDGDWILREDEEAMTYVLTVLSDRGSRYRFGAPLDRRWLAGGWSSHLEHRVDSVRLRTDFVTRPPRILEDELAEIWRAAEGAEIPVVAPEPLAQLKKTNREKDYVVIGELARRMGSPRSQLLFSRSARDLMRIAQAHPETVREIVAERPVLEKIGEGQSELESALDAERRALMHSNEKRLALYREASREWSEIWFEVSTEIADLPLVEAHALVVARAENVLPFGPANGGFP